MAEELAGAVAPVEVVTPPPGANPVIAPDAPAGQDQVTPQGDEPVKPPKTYSEEEHRKGISERLSKERKRLERTLRAELRAEAAERELQTLKNPPQQHQPKGAPKPEDYGNDFEAYLIAKAKHEFREEMAKERESSQRETAQQQQERYARERAEGLQAKFAAARERYEDFDEVVLAPHVPFTEPMAAFFAESDKGGDLAHHLATNLAEAKRIANLTPAGVFRELVKLEATLSAPPKPTQAPPPIVPNGGNASVKKDYTEMNTDEHVRAYLTRPKR